MEEFSHTSDVYKRNNEVDLASALRGSISFGRFLSETLDWEKWSVFCHNKHLEEAKNCSVPGSVAQKKAYFEAHYRRAASLKSDAVLEPENDKPSIDYSGSPTEDERQKPDDSSWMETEIEERRNDRHLQSAYNHGLERMEVHKGGSATGEKVTVPSKESEAFASNNAEKLQEKEPPKEISIKDHQNKEQNKKILTTYGLKSNGIRENSGISYSYASRFWKSIAKENKPPQGSMATNIRSSERRKVASGSLHMSISVKPVQNGQEPSRVNKILPIFQKVGNSKAGCTLSRASEHRYNHIKTPAKASISGGLEQTISTPKTKHKRAELPSYEASSGSKKVDAKLCSPSINCFKSPNATVKKEIDAGSASSSCKFNEKHAESEIRKLRQSYCFKAKPLPDFYHGTKSSEAELRKDAESEMRKLGKSCCFKAKPLPDFYHNSKPPELEEKKDVECEIRKPGKSCCFKAKPLPDFYHNSKPSELEEKKIAAVRKPASPSFARSKSPSLISSCKSNKTRQMTVEKRAA